MMSIPCQKKSSVFWKWNALGIKAKRRRRIWTYPSNFCSPLNMIGLSKMHCFIDGFLLEFFFFFSRVCWDQGETLLMWMQMPAITSFEHKLLYSLLCQDRFLKLKDICFVGRHTWLLLFSCFFLFDWPVSF